jgi:hypothetical protein
MRWVCSATIHGFWRVWLSRTPIYTWRIMHTRKHSSMAGHTEDMYASTHPQRRLQLQSHEGVPWAGGMHPAGQCPGTWQTGPAGWPGPRHYCGARYADVTGRTRRDSAWGSPWAARRSAQWGCGGLAPPQVLAWTAQSRQRERHRVRRVSANMSGCDAERTLV